MIADQAVAHFTGLAKPPHVCTDWIYSTPDKITGHAYAESNFNKTGEYYNDLLMGPAFAASGTVGGGKSNDNALLTIAIITVVAIVVLMATFQFAQQKKNMVQPVLPAMLWRPLGPAVQYAPPTGPGMVESPAIQFCPNCGNPAGEESFCIRCGYRVK